MVALGHAASERRYSRGPLWRHTLLLIPDPEEGGCTARVPVLPGLTVEVDTIEDAIANARDAIGLWIRALREEPPKG